MGVQTVMYVATIFGANELKLPAQSLIVTVLLIQLVGIVGSYTFSYLSSILGNIYALMIGVTIWIGICAGAYYTTQESEFYVLAAVVGMVMGGVQSLSRATYSKLIPDDTQDTASYFSFYDVTEKVFRGHWYPGVWACGAADGEYAEQCVGTDGDFYCGFAAAFAHSFAKSIPLSAGQFGKLVYLQHEQDVSSVGSERRLDRAEVSGSSPLRPTSLVPPSGAGLFFCSQTF